MLINNCAFLRNSKCCYRIIAEAEAVRAKAVAEPLTNIDSITMYGEGNTAKLVGDITSSTTQISSGLLDGMGISLKDLVNSVLTGRAMGAGMNMNAGAANIPASETLDTAKKTEKFVPAEDTLSE